MNVIIREAEAGDAKGIATVHVEMWRHAYRGQIPDSVLDNLSIESKTDSWREQIENPHPGTYAYVACIGENVVGWVTGGVSRDKDLPDDVGELYGIYVLPGQTGKGIGYKLMSKLLGQLRRDKYSRVTLWVLNTNTPTQQWYARKGWVKEGETKVETRDGFELHEERFVLDL